MEERVVPGRHAAAVHRLGDVADARCLAACPTRRSSASSGPSSTSRWISHDSGATLLVPGPGGLVAVAVEARALRQLARPRTSPRPAPSSPAGSSGRGRRGSPARPRSRPTSAEDAVDDDPQPAAAWEQPAHGEAFARVALPGIGAFYRGETMNGAGSIRSRNGFSWIVSGWVGSQKTRDAALESPQPPSACRRVARRRRTSSRRRQSPRGTRGGGGCAHRERPRNMRQRMRFPSPTASLQDVVTIEALLKPSIRGTAGGLAEAAVKL